MLSSSTFPFKNPTNPSPLKEESVETTPLASSNTCFTAVIDSFTAGMLTFLTNFTAAIAARALGINPRVSTSLINSVPKLTTILTTLEPIALFHIV